MREITNQISKGRGTMGVRGMPDRLDSGRCFMCSEEAAVRVNVDGVWCSLCEGHVATLREMLDHPLPAPEPRVR